MSTLKKVVLTLIAAALSAIIYPIVGGWKDIVFFVKLNWVWEPAAYSLMAVSILFAAEIVLLTALSFYDRKPRASFIAVIASTVAGLFLVPLLVATVASTYAAMPSINSVLVRNWNWLVPVTVLLIGTAWTVLTYLLPRVIVTCSDELLDEQEEELLKDNSLWEEEEPQHRERYSRRPFAPGHLFNVEEDRREEALRNYKRNKAASTASQEQKVIYLLPAPKTGKKENN